MHVWVFCLVLEVIIASVRLPGVGVYVSVCIVQCVPRLTQHALLLYVHAYVVSVYKLIVSLRGLPVSPPELS